MNIVMIGPFPNPITGQSIANRSVRNEFARLGLSVYAVNTNSSKINDISSQGRLALSTLMKAVLQQLRTIAYLFKTPNCKVYITPGQSLLGFLRYAPSILVAHYCKHKVTLHFHGAYFGQMYLKSNQYLQLLIRYILERTSRIIVLGPSLKWMFKQSDKIEEKVVCCVNGIPSQLLLSKDGLTKKQSKHDSSFIKLVYISNLIESKGILDLLDAMQILLNKGWQVSLDICGSLDQAIHDRFQKKFKPLKSYCTYHGVLDGPEKAVIFEKNEVFCLPTYYPVEGQPISILEAYGQGCAVVTTDHGGIKDIFVEGKNGVFCKPRDPNSVAEAIVACHEKYFEYSKNNHSTACLKFKEESFLSRVKAIAL